MKRIIICSLSFVLIGIIVTVGMLAMYRQKEPTISIKVEGENTDIPAYQGPIHGVHLVKGYVLIMLRPMI